MNLLNRRIKATSLLYRHSSKVLVAVIAALVITSIALTPALQSILLPHFHLQPERLGAFRSLLVGVGASLIGATAIIFSVVMLAVQLNFARIPFGLFRRLSSDLQLLISFAATFMFGVTIGVSALLPDETWIASIVVLSSWCVLAALSLFFIAYKRALDLISPGKQMRMVLHKADRSMRRWQKRADRFAPLLDNKPALGLDRDIARASFFKLHPHWESDVREASSHVLAFARRYAEQGEYDVSAIALNGLVAINSRYISARGDTFFASNPFFTNPLATEPFISDTLEKLRRLANSSQGRSDEEQFIQVMSTLTNLCTVYARIDYGSKRSPSLHHAQLASSYLAGVVQGAPRAFGPDVLMEGARHLGQCALVLVQAHQATGAITIAKSISDISLLGLTKSGYEPVTITAVQQLANVTFSILRSEEHDVRYSSEQVRSCIRTVAQAVMLTRDTSPSNQHSAHLKPYYSTADYGTFTDNLTKLVNAVMERSAKDDVAERIISHLSDWSEGIYAGEKQLLIAAVKTQSSLAQNLISWIFCVTELLVSAARAPAASDHDCAELTKNAIWLVSVLDWIPGDKETVAFVDGLQLIEQLFDFALKMHIREEDEIAEATRSILLRWSLKAGQHQTGWGSLESALTALCVLAVWKEDSGWEAWLKAEFANCFNKALIDQEIRMRAALELRKIAQNPSSYRHGFHSVGYHAMRVDYNRLAESMTAIADLLDPQVA